MLRNWGTPQILRHMGNIWFGRKGETGSLPLLFSISCPLWYQSLNFIVLCAGGGARRPRQTVGAGRGSQQTPTPVGTSVPGAVSGRDHMASVMFITLCLIRRPCVTWSSSRCGVSRHGQVGKEGMHWNWSRVGVRSWAWSAPEGGGGGRWGQGESSCVAGLAHGRRGEYTHLNLSTALLSLYQTFG